MAARLYAIPGSHPCVTAELALERKGIPYERTDLPPVASIPVLRSLGFPRRTVPALKLDGRRIQGSRELTRTLEELRPEPPLFPRDAEARRKVEEAEGWGDEVLQSLARRITLRVLVDEGRAGIYRPFVEGARFPLGLPASVAAYTTKPALWADCKVHGATREQVRRDVTEVDAVLDHADALIAEGVIGGEDPNAADLQIAPSVRLLMIVASLRPRIEERPAGQLALRLVPEFAGDVPGATLA